ncbi:tetratricopeptide repeat protein 1 [Arachis ipaensis]|uniref:tetratricopeptide repeat protein 1 n=1 Tax=Arachis ipaensis TaxID=130454 RepID=UPI0007AFC426|nr:tetratricopeptide repeat protein 1 [Arachis ipaensis]
MVYLFESSFVLFAQCAGILLVQKEITQPQSKNPSTVSLHHRRKEWHTAASVALKVRHPSVYLASLVIQVFNPCSLSLIAAASSSSASVVFVCSGALPSPFVCRSRSRLRSAVVFVSVLRRSRSLGVHCSRSLAVCRSSLHSCASGSHVALLQILRPTCALHLAVELLSFVAAVVREEEKEETKKESRDKQGKEATEDIIQQEEHVTLTTLFVDSKYEETLSQYELALQVALNMSLSVEVRLICHANRAACYQKLGKYDSTVKECTQALELNPAYIKALARRGEAHDKLEHFEEAIADMKRILEIDPSNDQARKGICRLEPLAAEKREKMKEEMMDKFFVVFIFVF